MSKTGPPRLGRGLSALIDNTVAATPSPPPVQPISVDPTQRPQSELRLLNLSEIRKNPLQPRRNFDPDKLGRLADSIARRGTLQPVVVRKVADGYELVAGERRWRAAEIAGLKSIPAVVRQAADGELLELALIENLQREDLNALERARAYLELKTRLNIDNNGLAARIGEDRTTVANYLRILDLSDDILDLLVAGTIEMGHARALLGLPDPKSRSALARKIADEGWPVRRVEQHIREQAARKPSQPAGEAAPRPAISDLEQRLSETLGLRVRIRERSRKNTGRIIIEYYSLDDFEYVTSRLGLKPEAP
jgi:ParB family chromosome partitioning protein